MKIVKLHTLITLIAVGFTLVAHSQDVEPRSEGIQVKGQLKDSVSKGMIEFASVSLFRVADSSVATGALSDESGAFVLNNVQPGKYYIRITSIGYKEKSIGPLQIQGGRPIVDIGNIWLRSGVELDEVEIVEYTEVLEMNLDKKVINVEKDLTSTGGTALDLMKNVPSVSVDMDGNVSMRGNENVRLLIDGKPSTMDSNILLQQLPASMVKQIEVITNPSAKYDPDGVTGIINIVTKQNKQKGFNGVIQINEGTGSNQPGGRWENFTINKHNFNTTVNYRAGKWNLFATYDIRQNNRWNTHRDERSLMASDSTNTVLQDGGKMRPGLNNSFKGGFDFNINESNSLTFTGNVRTDKGTTEENIDYYEYYDNNIFISDYKRYNRADNSGFNYDLNLDYKKTFKEKGRELTALAAWSVNEDLNTTYINESYYDAYNVQTNQNSLIEAVDQNSGNTALTLQLDYVHPLKEKRGRMETGLKLIARDIYQDRYVETNNTPLQTTIVDSSRTNRFEYDDQIYSAYVIYGNAYKKWKYQAGVRFEQALTHSQQVTSKSDFERDFYNFFPSAHLRYELNDKSEFSASYSRRIQRPSVRQLNPFPDYSDKLSWRVGNPYLFPEYTNSFELGYSYMQRGTMFSSTIFYRRTNNVIYRYATVNEISGVKQVDYVNMLNSDAAGFEGMYNQPITKWMRVNANFSAFYTRLEGNEQYNVNTNTNFAYTSRVSLNVTAIAKIEWQFTGSYRSPMLAPQGQMKPMYFLDIGLKRDIMKKQASISFRVSDVFNNMRFAIDVQSSNFTSNIHHKWESRVAYLTFQYRINNGQERKEKRRGEMEGGSMDMGM